MPFVAINGLTHLKVYGLTLAIRKWIEELIHHILMVKTDPSSHAFMLENNPLSHGNSDISM